MSARFSFLKCILLTVVGIVVGSQVFADSISLSETWKDTSGSGGVVTSKDTGSLTASLTVPGLSSLTADDWSNLDISISMTPYQGSQFTSDTMSDAPNWGGTVNGTSATFYFQGVDTNGNFVNIEKITFTRSANTLTISDQTINPAAVQPPWSILAENYLNVGGPVTDSQAFEVTLSDTLASGTNLNADIAKTIYITGTDTVTYDSFSNPLNNVSISGAADYTAPVVTSYSPSASLSTSNGLLTLQVKATDNIGVSSVDFMWNKQDYGTGNTSTTNIWTEMFALAPGTNLLQTVATDASGNVSATNSITVTYLVPQSGGNSIQFSEHWLDNSEVDGSGNTNFTFNQDVGVLTASFTVNGLQSIPAATWSNMVLTVSFGGIDFSNKLSAADIMSATSATFYTTDFDLNDNIIDIEQLTVSRSGNTLYVFKRTGNPSYAPDNTPIIANNYFGTGTLIHDQQPFALTLADGSTQSSYLAVSKTIFISGTDITNADSSGDELDNIQVSGLADYIAPTIQIVSPSSGQLWSNSVFTVTGKAADNVLVTNVYISINNSPYVPATPVNGWTNWTAQANLIPGTNSMAAYAVDSSGNQSQSVYGSIVYVISAPLAVSITGLGTISPNDNGALLQIGKNYTMTATPASGFKFLNWTGSETTNSPALQFNMQSNLLFTANFADTNRPTVSVTNLIAGQHVSNAVFTVSGKASDNWMVSNVWVQVNGTGWTNGTSGNNWSNWTATVNLMPGTNNLQYYAMDTSGNFSTTNSVSFVYVVSAPLLVQLSGLGTISPNYSNAMLAVGQNYTVSATPASGFKFISWVVSTNWIGGNTFSNASLQFMMASNLTLQANFADTNRPTVSVTNIIAGQHVSNAVFTVSGKASDNWMVSNVWVQVNGNGWTNGTSGNNWSNWTATVNLIPGTNSLQYYAMDTSGNFSTTNNLSFVYVVSAPLLVQITGLGTISPNYSNAMLAIGQNYTITATPASGFKFTNWIVSTNWVVGSTSNNASLKFMMASNLTLQANFIDTNKPTLSITSPTANQKITNSSPLLTGKASDNWKISGVWYQLNGGDWLPASTTNNWTTWYQTISPANGTNVVKAYAQDMGGNYSPTNSVSFTATNSVKLQMALSATSVTSSNGVTFSLQLTSNATGRIQFTTNFVDWTTLTSFNSTNSVNFNDPGATNSPFRFYRAVVP